MYYWFVTKTSSVWECQQCGSQFPKWSGKCPDCGQWNTLVETVVSAGEGRRKKEEGRGRAGAGAAKPQKLSDILKDIDTTSRRISTGIGELDRVLGGGLVPGQVALLAGEPGMGKSTLLSQVALRMIQNTRNTQSTGQSENQKPGKSENNLRHSDSPILRQSGSPSIPSFPKVLYVCGEESPSQVGLRLRRLANNQQSTINNQQLSLYPQTDVDAVITEILRFAGNDAVSAVIIDSIQTMATADLSGLAGAVGQVRESTGRLSQIAKSLNIPLFLVGHVTKEGEVAGPKVLEHMVDTVLVMEGDRSGNLRILRSLKNRFGPVDEVGIFSMDDGGMAEVKNPAELLVGDFAGRAPGSVLGCVLEGQRPLVLEVQALTVPTKLSFPRRVGHGINERRLQLLCAVIEKHLGLGIGEKDVFVNVAGGLKSSDPGLDLPVVAAIVSSANQGKREEGRGKRETHNVRVEPSSLYPLPSSLIFCGEVGLLGEIRMVPGWPRREKEVNRLGMGRLVGKPEIGHISQLQKFLR